MRLKHLALGLAVVTAVPAAVATAQAEDGIYVPFFTYRTGPYSGSGIPVANGLSDYMKMLNERDGGIGGVKIIIEECETGYDTKKGVECYDTVKGKNPVVITPFSTGITLQVIPKATVDKIPVFSICLRPICFRRRQSVPVDLQCARDLLGRRVGVRPSCRRCRRRL